ncbi:hypothetical protein GS682_04980 [Nostoc sp. B(2019)]|nr:hypothetical protein [Nostoc sp. B(2019)]
MKYIAAIVSAALIVVTTTTSVFAKDYRGVCRDEDRCLETAMPAAGFACAAKSDTNDNTFVPSDKRKVCRGDTQERRTFQDMVARTVILV